MRAQKTYYRIRPGLAWEVIRQDHQYMLCNQIEFHAGTDWRSGWTHVVQREVRVRTSRLSRYPQVRWEECYPDE
jgi:hypothetical protein